MHIHNIFFLYSRARYNAANLLSPNNYDTIHVSYVRLQCTSVSVCDSINSLHSSQLNLVDEWTVDWNSISLGKKLGEGEFSTVHRGLMGYERVPQPRQRHYARASVVPVAIKVIKGTKSTSIHSAKHMECTRVHTTGTYFYV